MHLFYSVCANKCVFLITAARKHIAEYESSGYGWKMENSCLNFNLDIKEKCIYFTSRFICIKRDGLMSFPLPLRYRYIYILQIWSVSIQGRTTDHGTVHSRGQGLPATFSPTDKLHLQGSLESALAPEGSCDAVLNVQSPHSNPSFVARV